MRETILDFVLIPSTHCIKFHFTFTLCFYSKLWLASRRLNHCKGKQATHSADEDAVAVAGSIDVALGMLSLGDEVISISGCGSDTEGSLEPREAGLVAEGLWTG